MYFVFFIYLLDSHGGGFYSNGYGIITLRC